MAPPTKADDRAVPWTTNLLADMAEFDIVGLILRPGYIVVKPGTASGPVVTFAW